MALITGRSGNRNRNGIFLVLAALLAAVFVISLGVGRFAISPGELAGILLGRIDAGSMEARVFLSIRLPRIAAAMLIGAALSASGAAYQSVFRNPLVSPDILGAAAGASFGAVLAFLLGWPKFAVLVCAFCCGLLGVALSAVAGARFSGRYRDGAVTLVLCGMVVTAVFSAFISGAKIVADPYDELPTITFWLMGGLSYAAAEDVLIMAGPLLIGGIFLFLLRYRINVLSLPDEEVAALGIDAGRTRGAVVLCATLLTSACVAVGGMIGWVGLIVPHIARLVVGPENSRLLPASLLIGASFLLVVDNFARTLLSLELPLGVLTAAVGAPVFLFLLSRAGIRD